MLLRKKQATSQKRLDNYIGFSVSGTVMFGQENNFSIFHNFLPDLHNNPDELLNQRRLYTAGTTDLGLALQV